jgi:HEAT repeat protein
MKKLINILCILILPVFAVRVFAGDLEDLTKKLYAYDINIQISAVEELAKRGDEKAVEALLEFVFMKTENWKVKVRAIRLLGDIPDTEVSDKLVTVFNDPFLNYECPAMKWHTAVALGHRHNKGTRAVDALIDALDYNNLLIQEAAIQSLGKIGDPLSVPYLITALNDDRFAVKYNAVKALENIGSKEAVPFLQKIADTEKDPLLKEETQKAIKNINQN